MHQIQTKLVEANFKRKNQFHLYKFGINYTLIVIRVLTQY